MKFNFWQFVNEKISGRTAGDAAYRQQSDTVKAAAPALAQSLEAALVQGAVQSAASQAEKVLPLGGLTAGFLDTVLTGNETSTGNETLAGAVKGQ